jgi:GxxExxY protein
VPYEKVDKGREPQMDTDKHRWNGPSAELSFLVIGCAMEILNTIGHGLHEKPYENALVVELALRRIPFEQQRSFGVSYKGTLIGEFIPDLLVGQDLIVETKVIAGISDHERGQVINYLRITRRRVGLILNFRRAKLEWERVIL